MPIKVFTRLWVPATSDRKVKYRLDTAYREKAKSLSRRSYRRRVGVELENCLYSLQFLEQLGDKMAVKLPNGVVKVLHVFSLSETANILQKRYQTIWRWITHGMIPEPVLVVVHEHMGKPPKAFHIEEVRIFIEEIGAHEKKVKYFRRDHQHVTARIERRVSEFRNKLNRK